MKLMRNRLQKVIVALIVSWLTLFVLLPNLMIFATSFLTRDDAHFVSMAFTLNNYTRLLDPLYADVLLHSLNMALIATLCCLLLGYPFAWCLTKLPARLRPLMLFLLIVPFWTNSLIRIYGLKIFLSTRGWLNEFLLWLGVIDKPFRIMYTSEAVILGLIYILLPFMVLPLYSSLEKLDKSCLEAARDLGANKVKTFLRIILPLTMPGIVAGCLLVFILAIGYYITPALLGSPNDQMVSYFVAFYTNTSINWGMATALGGLLLLATVVLYLMYNWLVGASRLRLS